MDLMLLNYIFMYVCILIWLEAEQKICHVLCLCPENCDSFGLVCLFQRRGAAAFPSIH